MPKKNEKLSNISIEKMKETKFKKLSSKYNWIIVEPYLDMNLNNGSSNRKIRYITLREFRDNIKSSISIKKMIEQKISKHLLQFFSNFCQGKIKLTKEEFNNCYNKGMSLEEISKKYVTTREDTTFLRELYDIKRKGATFLKRKETEIPLTQRQKEILYGSMLGDAKRNNPKWNSVASFCHSEKQKEYLMWKYNEFKHITSENALRKYSNRDKRNNKINTGWSFHTIANSDVEEIIDKFYKIGTKEVTNDILNNLTLLSLAVWFMDDGYSGKNSNKINNCIFCTESFSQKSCENIVIWFKEKWNINASLQKRLLKNKIGYRVVIISDSVDNFINLISPYIISSMKYKIDYSEYLKKKNNK